MDRLAVVTGASSGIGYATTLRLLKLGYRVIGISRNIEDDCFNNSNFQALKADLTNKKDIELISKEFKGKNISILINSAGFGRFEPHEELSHKTIIDMVFLLNSPYAFNKYTFKRIKKE